MMARLMIAHVVVLIKRKSKKWHENRGPSFLLSQFAALGL